MVRFENHCVGCGSGYRRGCYGCTLNRVAVFYCDKCREEIDDESDIYDVNGKMLCGSCLENAFLGIGTTDEEKCDSCGAILDGDWYDDGVPVCFECLANMYKDNKEYYYD